MRVLVSGFEPFDGGEANPSQSVVAALVDEPPRGVEVATVVLPVRFASAWPALRSAMQAHAPHVVLALGQAGGAAGVLIEQVALNLDGPDRPDEDGTLPVDEPIVAGAPLAYRSGLPVRSLVAGLRDIGIPARASRHAGGHLCNHVFFRLCHLAATEDPGVTAGFVHLPYLPEQVLDEPAPSMPLTEMVRAVGHVVEHLPAAGLDVSAGSR